LGAQRHQLYSRMIVCELVSRTASWTWLDLPHEGEGSSVVATTRGGRRRPPHSRWNTPPPAPRCVSRFPEKSTGEWRPQRLSEMYPTKSQSAKLWGTSHSDYPPRSSDVSSRSSGRDLSGHHHRRLAQLCGVPGWGQIDEATPRFRCTPRNLNRPDCGVHL